MNTVLHPCVTNPAGAHYVDRSYSDRQEPHRNPADYSSGIRGGSGSNSAEYGRPDYESRPGYGNAPHMKTTEVTAATAMNLSRQDPLSLPAKALPAMTATKTADSIGPIFSVPRKRTTDLTI